MGSECLITFSVSNEHHSMEQSAQQKYEPAIELFNLKNVEYSYELKYNNKL